MTDTERCPLPGGFHAEFRVSLTGADQKWFYSQRGRLMRENGTGKPARSEPDPANPAQLKTYPAEPPYLTEDDNFTMFDMLTARLMVSCTMPGLMPWTGEVRDTADLDVVEAIDAAVLTQMRRLQGIPAPKREPSGGTGGSSSPEAADAPQAEPTPETSTTLPG